MNPDVTPTAIERDSVGGSGLTIDPSAIEGDEIVRPRPRRRWLRAIVLVVVALVGYYAITLLHVHLVGADDQARPVDAIIVMGAAQYDGTPSPQLQARLDHVVDLYERGIAPIVVVTGGKQAGDRFTEAEASAAYLTDHGVPETSILREDQGHSSWASLSTVAEMLERINAQRVILVSDPYHSLRIRLMAEDLGLTAYVSPTRTSPVSGARAFGKEMKEAAGIAVARIIGFDRLLSITG